MPAKEGDLGHSDQPVFRLSGVLARRQEKEGSLLKLAEKINEANGSPSTMVLDRRKLKRVIDGDPRVPLSIREFFALDRYLERFHEGLAQKPLLEKPSILETLTEGEHLTFLLGARPRENRVDLSNWDVLAMAEILRGAGGFRQVKFDLRPVLLHETLAEVRKTYPSAGRSQRKQTWLNLLRDGGPSLVCCGSPRSCHAAEVMLARMFEMEPFDRAYGRHPRLPFHFVWRTKAEVQVPSRFEFTAEDLAGMAIPLDDQVGAGGARAFLAEDEVYLVDPPGRKRKITSYGVVVAQRRQTGQIWMVIAGLGGAATHAAARCVKEIHSSLPPATRTGRKSRVLWVLVKATAEKERRKASTRIHRVTDQEVLGGLRLY